MAAISAVGGVRVAVRPSVGGTVARLSVYAVLLVMLLAFGLDSQDDATIVSFAAIYAMVALSLNVLIGYLGQLSLGHQGFVGAGACFAAYFATKQGLPFAVSLAGGTLMGALFALVLGLVALRITGLYLALVTLVFGLTLKESLFVLPSLTNGGAGQKADRPIFLESNITYFFLCAALLAVVFYFDRQLTSSKGGRALLAVKENERVAEAFGINVTAYKLIGFTFSGAVAGLAGGLFAFNTQQFNGITYDFPLALTFVVATVVGGAGSRVGVLIGGASFYILRPFTTFLLSPIPENFHPHGVFGIFDFFFSNKQYIPDLIGVLLLLLTLVRFPGGIAQQLGPVFRWLAFKPWDPHGDTATGPGAVEGSSVRA